MQLTIYSFIICVGIFLIQLFFITRKNKIVYNDIQKKIKTLEISYKILVALIISIIVGVLSSYILFIYVLIGLNAGL